MRGKQKLRMLCRQEEQSRTSSVRVLTLVLKLRDNVLGNWKLIWTRS